MTLRATVATALTCILLSTAAVAGERGSAEEAIALWNKGKSLFQKQGAATTMAAINDKSAGLIDRDLYVFCYDSSKKIAANGLNAKLVGVDATTLRDADGKAFAAEIISIAQAGKNGWVDFKWPDPLTKKIMQKSSYVGAYGDYACGVGIYK